MFTNKVYSYDYRGFLIQEPNITYTYDDNGNILTKGNTTFTYDENIKDKLIKVNNDEVIYGNDNLLNPIKYKNNTYKYEGRRLTKFNNGKQEYEYLYNDQGLRTIKKEDSKIINEYYYDEDRLIYEKTTKGNIKYLYDENNLLYGFIYNKQKYIYIRDVLQNILGIATEEGKVVVKYDYTAYGEIVEVYDNTNYELSKINPFRYKGYYYDEETGWFWLSSRYYSPELCRFISPDDVDYLDQTSINGLNLYAYANNNPIMYIDPDGHSAILIGLIIGALIGFGTAAYIDYQDDGQIFNGSVAWYDYLGATVLGGAIGAGLGAFAGMSFSASIPTFGWINSGGALMFGITGTTAITVTGAQVLGVAGAFAAGGLLMFAKGNGPRMGHNQYENKQIDSLCKKYNLSKDQRRILHDYISGQNYSYKEIERIIIELFFS